MSGCKLSSKLRDKSTVPKKTNFILILCTGTQVLHSVCAMTSRPALHASLLQWSIRQLESSSHGIEPPTQKVKKEGPLRHIETTGSTTQTMGCNHRQIFWRCVGEGVHPHPQIFLTQLLKHDL